MRKPEEIEALFLDPVYNRFEAPQSDFTLVPDSPIVYWLSDAMKRAFAKGTRLAEVASPRQGLATADNDRFLRLWFEVSGDRTRFDMASRQEAKNSGRKWFPHNKGGAFRKWWGNQDYVVNWENDGKAVQGFVDTAGKQRSRPQNIEYYFRPCVSWSNIAADPSFRYYPANSIFSHKGQAVFGTERSLPALCGFMNCSVAQDFLDVIAPTLMSFEAGHIGSLPIFSADSAVIDPIVDELIALFRADWNDYETSWDFTVNPLTAMGAGLLEAHAQTCWDTAISTTLRAQELEQANNRYFAKLYELEDEVSCDVPLNRVSLTQNPYFRYAPNSDATRTEDEYRTLFLRDLAKELISYAVGVMMGRYSLEQPGLILADAGATIADFDSKVSAAGFRPDTDSILPITTERYFEDDIVARLRQFLAAAFGAENVEANIAWLEHALGSGNRKDIRDYFLRDFYADHVKTYSKRPIYWQVSSPKGGFNALFYLHRYSPATLGLIHQNYAEDVIHKITARLGTIEYALPTAGKREATRLGKERDTLTARRREIRGWIDDALFPLATAEIGLDLDDGVKHNYPKLAGVVKKVAGL